MRFVFKIGLLCLVFICGVQATYGQKTSSDKGGNLNHITVSLLTLGSDQFLYSSWGHSTLRIQDKQKGTDTTYNWGIYDPKTPIFLWKFVKETLPYKLYVMPTKGYINFILGPKNRRIVEDKIIIFISLFTERSYFNFGANTWILNILDFWLIWPAWKLITNQVINTKLLEKIGIAHLIGIGLCLLFSLMGIIEQDITIPLQSIIPAGTLFSILFISVNRGRFFKYTLKDTVTKCLE